ncbi:MAG: HEAT repeat domain-containing protein [Candidatus Poseidoniaceae archaeon]|nr:HEAT repeat domain-containing protein [Candidatus Poseidoniaceae archaeon]
MTVTSSTPEVSDYGSVDPAPPATHGSSSDHRGLLLDEDARMFERMRAVFALRNDGSDGAVDALCSAFSSSSALLRHELAYVLGQMQNPRALATLWERLEDEKEHVMVRHEAAEAMGASGDGRSRAVLERFLDHPAPEISESCEVALDLLDWCERAEWNKE